MADYIPPLPLFVNTVFSNKIDPETASEETSEEIIPRIADFECSIQVLYESFITWHRLQNQGIVKTQSRDSIQYAEEWQERYPEKFHMLHSGSRCKESEEIGQGKYSKVYKLGNYAYKIVKTIGDGRVENRSLEDVSQLKCNIKEMCFFHSMNHPNIMKCTRSQMIMQHGKFTKLIHEMLNARCTLEQMIEAQEINCFQDFTYMMSGIAKGLQYMHKYEIVHGDLKPSNILINKQYQALISDFTLTTFEKKGQEVAFGTLYWRSPECLLMRECNRPADVWSFGMILLDCLYGCVYTRDIVEAETNEEMLSKLIYIIGQPPVDWVQKYIPDKKHLLYMSYPKIADNLQRARIQMNISEKEWLCTQDLITRILQWDPAHRCSMDDILQHPFFAGKIINLMPQLTPSKNIYMSGSLSFLEMPNDSKWNIMPQEYSCVIQWRAQAEKDFLQRWIKYYYHETFKSHIPDWLLYDTLILTKRILDQLKTLEVTFHVKNVIKTCCKFYFFIWKNYWPDDPCFECSLFHILYLLRFQIFNLKVEEVFVKADNDAEEKKAGKEEVKVNTGVETDVKSKVGTEAKSEVGTEIISFTFGNGHDLVLSR